MSYKKQIIINGISYDIAVTITGEGAPTESTEAEPGMWYLDTAADRLYYCLSASDGVYVWREGVSPAALAAIEARISKLEASAPVKYDGTVTVS